MESRVSISMIRMISVIPITVVTLNHEIFDEGRVWNEDSHFEFVTRLPSWYSLYLFQICGCNCIFVAMFILAFSFLGSIYMQLGVL